MLINDDISLALVLVAVKKISPINGMPAKAELIKEVTMSARLPKA